MSRVASDAYRRTPQREADQLLKQVLRYRAACRDIEKPCDVNQLIELFPRVSIEDGYILDYEVIESSMASWIRPYARRLDEAPRTGFPRVIHVFDRDTIAGYGQSEEADRSEVDTLYRHLRHESNVAGVFEYAFFVVELWSTRATWHAAEWLDSTPVFSKRRFDAIVGAAEVIEQLERPAHYGPLALMEGRGGRCKFLVYSEVGLKWFYYLDGTILEDGRVDVGKAEIVANFGRGWVY